MSSRNYRDLIARRKAFELALAIYEETSFFPKEEKYGLTMRVRRAGVSIPSNIAEGQGRGYRREFLRHLSIAMGSLKESETQLLIADARGYLRPGKLNGLMKMADEVGRLITGLSKSLLTTNH